MPGPLGTPCNMPPVDAGTLARTLSTPAGITGNKAAVDAGSTGPRADVLVIHLDLAELIEIQEPRIGPVRRSGSLESVDVMVKGPVIAKDLDRPKKVLTVVRKLFSPLADVIAIELSDGSAAAGRLLKTHFGWPMINTAGEPQVSKKHGQFYDPYYVGAGATSTSRSKLEAFKPIKGDPSKGVTAYVFEGAIGVAVMEHFEPGKANVDNIFAAAIAHELGHNLGLPHGKSPADIMFVYANEDERDQKKWMMAASENKLAFNATQLASMRTLLRKP